MVFREVRSKRSAFRVGRGTSVTEVPLFVVDPSSWVYWAAVGSTWLLYYATPLWPIVFARWENEDGSISNRRAGS
jgi:hypothetical protein